MHSVISFPERGPWGNSKWRGNASGFVYKSLFEQLKPKTFCDPMKGSGTSIEVAQEMGIKAYGLDLYEGFNAVQDSILNHIGQQVDLCVSHPPYLDMILYSGNVWGDKPHPADLSRCASSDDFHEKMQLVLLNQRDATLPGGFYGALVGDLRRNGTYVSTQAELIARMPSSELASVIIKMQHNCVSDSRVYSNMSLPRIMHEYLILWRKKTMPIMVLLNTMAREQHSRVTGTWKSIVGVVLQRLGGKANLSEIYQEVGRAAPDKLKANPNWEAKIRQTLNSNGLFASTERGVWALA